jgi:hypothetical protein
MPNMRRDKIETRSGGVCTISLSRNSLTPRLSYAACYTVSHFGGGGGKLTYLEELLAGEDGKTLVLCMVRNF